MILCGMVVLQCRKGDMLVSLAVFLCSYCIVVARLVAILCPSRLCNGVNGVVAGLCVDRSCRLAHFVVGFARCNVVALIRKRLLEVVCLRLKCFCLLVCE